jgi:hypothetical protein
MTYVVRDGVLQIGFRSNVNVKTREEISAWIVIPAVDYISVTGAGNFTLNGEKQPSLEIYIQGAGDVDAFGLEVDDCTINIEGAGDCQVNVNRNLDVVIAGVGNVTYRGEPTITSDISGVGNISASLL